MSPESSSPYKPGVCNIGQPEIRVRKIFLRFFIVTSIVLTGCTFFWFQSLIVWALLLFSSFSLTVLYYQIKYRFCILFGFFNLHNFKQLGQLEEVKHPEYIHKDRKRVGEIILQSLAFSLVYASAIHLIAEKVKLH